MYIQNANGMIYYWHMRIDLTFLSDKQYKIKSISEFNISFDISIHRGLKLFVFACLDRFGKQILLAILLIDDKSPPAMTNK